MHWYRIDYYRLARTEDEIIRHKLTTEFIDHTINKLGRNNLRNEIPDGYILDSFVINDTPGLSGKEVLEKHIRTKYKEATLSSWDEWDR
jgi:hypothetical protein